MKIMHVRLKLCIFIVFGAVDAADYGADTNNALEFVQNPAPDGHRCGACPTYFQKICAFDTVSNNTYIFDNHCIMDLYNCIEGSAFFAMKYEKCLFFSNFAYVHGFKYEDQDYGEDHIHVRHTNKNLYHANV